MKSKFVILVICLTLMLSAFPIGKAANAAGGISLQSFQFHDGKGWILYFSVDSELTERQLSGNQIVLDGISYDLKCDQREKDQVICAITDLRSHIGKQASIYFAGLLFTATVPPAEAAFEGCQSAGSTLYSFRVLTDGVVTGWVILMVDNDSMSRSIVHSIMETPLGPKERIVSSGPKCISTIFH